MNKGKFKVKNVYNLTTEDVKDKVVYYRYLNSTFEPIAILTHADEDYIYGYFEHNQDYDMLIEGNPKYLSMEVVED